MDSVLRDRDRRGSDYWQILENFLSGIFKGCVTGPNSDGVKEYFKGGIVWALSDVSPLMSLSFCSSSKNGIACLACDLVNKWDFYPLEDSHGPWDCKKQDK